MLFYIFLFVSFFFSFSFFLFLPALNPFSLLLKRGSIFPWGITAFSLPDYEDQVRLIQSLL